MKKLKTQSFSAVIFGIIALNFCFTNSLIAQALPAYQVDTIMSCIDERFVFRVTLEDLGSSTSRMITLLYDDAMDFPDTVARNINSVPFVYEHPDTFDFGYVDFEILDEVNPSNTPIVDNLELYASECPEIQVNILTQEDCENEELTFSVEIDKVPSLDSRKILVDGVTVATGINSFPFTYQHPTVYAKNATVNVSVLDEVDPTYMPVNQLVNTTMYYCPRTVVCGDTIQMNYCYTPNDASEFLFQSDDGISPLEFRFIDGYSDEEDIYFTIYDGADQNAPIIYQGDYDFADFDDLTYRSSGNSLLFKINSGMYSSCTGDGVDPWVWQVSCYTPEMVTCGDTIAAAYCYEAADKFKVYTYQASDNTAQLQLKFTENELADFHDFIIYDGPTRTAPVLYDNSFIANGIHWQILSSGNFLFVEIDYFGLGNCIDDGDPPLEWEVSCFLPETVTCGNTLQDAYCYDFNEKQAFLYEADDDTGPLKIKFNSGYLEVNWGKITIYDGADATADTLYSGDNNGDLTDLEVLGTGANLFMVLEVEYQSITCASDGETPMDWEVSCFTPEPIAICQDTVMIAVDSVLTISQVNNGSYDPADLDFEIGFTLNDENDITRTYNCSQLGTQPLKLYAWNESGGIDSCQSIIVVKDTIPPMVTGCQDHFLNCSDDYSVATLGTPVFTDNCDTYTLSHKDSLIECGTVVRTWTALGLPSHDTLHCMQMIYRENNFDETDITWPRDTTLDGCLSDLANLPVVYQFPKLADTFCTALFVDYQQDTLYDDVYCFEIERNWTVTDTCGVDDIFNHTQYLRIDNPPAHQILSNCDTIPFCKEEFDNCNEKFIYHFLNFGEVCDSFPKNITLEIDWDNDGSIDDTRQFTTSYTEPAPYGIHSFTWTVTGFCGTETVCEEIIKIEDCNGDCNMGIPDTLLITHSQNIMAGDTLQACDYIEASNHLPASLQDITYKANCIRLMPGFSTEAGLDFHAYIEGCDESLQEPIQAIERNNKAEQIISESLMNLKIFPNPFRQQTTIQYTLGKTSKVNIKVLNATGQKIINHQKLQQKAGNQEFILNGATLPSGFYWIYLQANDEVKTAKIVVLE